MLAYPTHVVCHMLSGRIAINLSFSVQVHRRNSNSEIELTRLRAVVALGWATVPRLGNRHAHNEVVMDSHRENYTRGGQESSLRKSPLSAARYPFIYRPPIIVRHGGRIGARLSVGNLLIMPKNAEDVEVFIVHVRTNGRTDENGPFGVLLWCRRVMRLTWPLCLPSKEHFEALHT